jgi:hypothetical protein
VKIEEGKSIEVRVWGIVYLVHFTGCAATVDAEAASANARAINVVFIAFPPAISGKKAPRAYFIPRRPSKALALLAFPARSLELADLQYSEHSNKGED